MLSGYWLLSDLDGTLISTPHKAHGNYLSLTNSPCYAPLIRWLRNGGNLCVVTTADQRVLNQVYVPLQSTLREIESCYGVMSEECVAPRGTRVLQANEPPSGTLLLSLYTGAVLYHCTSSRVEMISSYSRSVHCATMEAVLLSRKYNVPMVSARVLVATVQNEQHSDSNSKHISDHLSRTTSKKGQSTSSMSDKAVNGESDEPKRSYLNGNNARMKYEEVESETRVCVRGTCMSIKTAEFIVEMIIDLYERYLFDLLNGDATVQKRVGQLSRRYREMWRHIFEFLDVLYKSYIATSSVSSVSSVNSNNDREKDGGSDHANISINSDANRSWEAGSLQHSLNWKREYIHKHRDLFVALGIVRLEFVSNMVYFDNKTGTKTKENNFTSASTQATTSATSSALTKIHSSEADKTTPTHTNETQRSTMLNTELNSREQVQQALSDQAFVKQCGVKVLTEHLDEACKEKARPVIEAFASTMTQILGVEASDIRFAAKSRHELLTVNAKNNEMLNSEQTKSNQATTESANCINNVDSAVKQYIVLSKEHNDLSNSLQGAHGNKAHDDANKDEVQVAQVILLGMPLALFTRYFTSTTVLPEFIRAGVQALPQPNSVVFCKLGISKSTALRYLLGNERVLACGGEPVAETTHEAIHVINSTSDRCNKSHSLAGAVRHGCSVALGDNPHTTDYELTVFPSIPFISVEKDSQRSRRHARIARSMTDVKRHNSNNNNINNSGGGGGESDNSKGNDNTKNSLIDLIRKKVNFVNRANSSGAEESKNDTSQTVNNNNNNNNNKNSCNVASVSTDVLSAQRSSGSLMNDKLLSHLLYVGGEEEGTAYFLTTLMNLLHVPHESAHVTGQAKISISEFNTCAKDAHKIARKKVVSSTFSKL